MASKLLLARSCVWARQFKCLSLSSTLSDQVYSGSDVGSLGGSGHVRDSGGAFGLREAAFEEQFFRRQADEQFRLLHSHHVDEIHFLENQITVHQEIIERHKLKLKSLQDLEKSIKK